MGLMIPDRYPAPNATRLFGDAYKIMRWRHITDLYAAESIERSSWPTADKMRLQSELRSRPTPTPEQVAGHEAETGHDVVAFLSAYTELMTNDLAAHIHRGLTSSDLVDNAHFMSLQQHALGMMRLLHELYPVMSRFQGVDFPRAGRTHGQMADVTSLGHQMSVHRATLVRIGEAFAEFSRMHVWKSPGPTGDSPLSVAVAARCIAVPREWQIVRSTQVIPRDLQLEWAALYLRLAGELESLATLIRCGARQEVGELTEGAVRVGSSSVPAKRNPIDSEKVCGLARVARGYFATIAENVALWDDRDISNSSVERIAVPDLAAVVEYMTTTMTSVVKNLQVNADRMREGASNPRTLAYYLQALAQQCFNIGPIRASRLVADYVQFDGAMAGPVFDVHGIANRVGAETEEVRAWFRSAVAIREGRL